MEETDRRVDQKPAETDTGYVAQQRVGLSETVSLAEQVAQLEANLSEQHADVSGVAERRFKRLAKENAGWGVRRISGSLKELGMPTSLSSVRRVLVNEGILPDPDRHALKNVTVPWRIEKLVTIVPLRTFVLG